MPLILIFILVPSLELYLLIKLGGIIGAGWTILLVLVTAVLGGLLLQQQGLSTWARAQRSLNHGEIPATEMFEGVILLVGGVLLLTPGLLTDAVGVLCLLPPSRRLMVAMVLRRVTVRQARQQSAGRVLDGEYRREE